MDDLYRIVLQKACQYKLSMPYGRLGYCLQKSVDFVSILLQEGISACLIGGEVAINDKEEYIRLYNQTGRFGHYFVQIENTWWLDLSYEQFSYSSCYHLLPENIVFGPIADIKETHVALMVQSLQDASRKPFGSFKEFSAIIR